jgi:BON domain
MSVNVIVRDGIVELWGAILDERIREVLRVAAENVPGDKRVKDHLVWIEAMSGMDQVVLVGTPGDVASRRCRLDFESKRHSSRRRWRALPQVTSKRGFNPY